LINTAPPALQSVPPTIAYCRNFFFFQRMKLPTSTFFLALLPGVLALGQSQIVAVTAGHGRLQLAGNDVDGQILLSANDWWGVIRAAADLAGDVGKVTGRNLTLGNWKTGGSISDNVHETRGWNNMETRGTETTVLYTYFPTTNNVNVSNRAFSYRMLLQNMK
jgi:hypothetical protein